MSADLDCGSELSQNLDTPDVKFVCAVIGFHSIITSIRRNLPILLGVVYTIS